MGVTCFTQEFTTSVAPSRMFKALILDSHNLIPKLVPQGIKSIEFVEGDGGVGSIKQTNFPEGGHFKHLKHRIDALDKANLVCKYTLIEGDVIFDRLEKGDVELKEEEIKQGKDKAMGLYKVVEEYLVANPDMYA
ncbi:hypothetical protein CDL15_Pgr011291 [Punica granatum]|uniref:Bet v I/Major latex protein domain-containing protein n=1 Tax=Punica granatum TaxID=22663 RepID=A0A218WE80_PUNGR|nr:hypothetical protein CDL15_Pgr011291 [Punica granatum]